jgi:hypothetical protein
MPPATDPPPANSSKQPAKSKVKHWTLTAEIDAAKHMAISRTIPHHLKDDNYAVWSVTVKNVLGSVDLIPYCLGTVPKPDATTEEEEYNRWMRADAVVKSILTNSMTEAYIIQMGSMDTAQEIWREARRLLSGQTITDWTLCLAKLTQTHYSEGEDVIDHLSKFRRVRQDMILMERPLPEDVFAGLLRISFPETWNYVFAALPDPYTPEDVEKRI